jgi:hypothetical protein
MEEAFSRAQIRLRMEEDSYTEETTSMDVLREIFVTERAFYGIVRYLDPATRNHVVAAHLRNVNTALNVVRTQVERPTTMVMNIDLSGNALRNAFLDPVPVVATHEQIVSATENHVALPAGTACAICQEDVACATRLRACGHSFHSQCISQWLGMNTRCPVCRHDIRLTNGPQNPPNEGDSMHPDE